ncbi:hypothetical protein [Sphingomonas hengshuiensis]|uniref:hypothetical protein n=1 Tax=Sphingomonas hengshuiensis TaxID=1609977 RepID=UPI0012B8B4DF|nr:hypothetical protein [Sphingomonas hengshuiensis]
MRHKSLRKARFDPAAREQERHIHRLMQGQRSAGYEDGVREATRVAIFNAAMAFFATREPLPCYRDELYGMIDEAVTRATQRRLAHIQHSNETLFERLDRAAREAAEGKEAEPK